MQDVQLWGSSVKFVRWEDLKCGMRLARPIYSRSGVLLHDRDAKLTEGSIRSVRNFGLLGIYILEPAEPLPPMSEEDLAFEKFEITTVAALQEEIARLIKFKKQNKLQVIVSQIIRQYGHLEGKIHFYQNLRSKDDYVFRHMFNTAILCTMMGRRMNLTVEDRQLLVTAALLHDIGKVGTKNTAVFGGENDKGKIADLYEDAIFGCELIEQCFNADGVKLKRICQQALKAQMAADLGQESEVRKMVKEAKILQVANKFDEITGMSLTGESLSEVKAVTEFMDNPGIYDPEAVRALIDSIYILFPGVSVELNTGEKALVINENPDNILKPTVISFRRNTIMMLSDRDYHDIRVTDIMKTLDNRYVMDKNAMQSAGISNSDINVP